MDRYSCYSWINPNEWFSQKDTVANSNGKTSSENQLSESEVNDTMTEVKNRFKKITKLDSGYDLDDYLEDVLKPIASPDLAKYKALTPQVLNYLHFDASSGQERTLLMLLAERTNARPIDSFDTNLSKQMRKREKLTKELLKTNLVNVNATNKDGHTALDFATKKQYPNIEICNLLRAHGASTTAPLSSFFGDIFSLVSSSINTIPVRWIHKNPFAHDVENLSQPAFHINEKIYYTKEQIEVSFSQNYYNYDYKFVRFNNTYIYRMGLPEDSNTFKQFYNTKKFKKSHFESSSYFVKFRISVSPNDIPNTINYLAPILMGENGPTSFKIADFKYERLSEHPSLARLYYGGQFTIYAQKDNPLSYYVDLLTKIECELKYRKIRPGEKPAEDFPLGKYTSVRLERDPVNHERLSITQNPDDAQALKYYYANSKMIQSCKILFNSMLPQLEWKYYIDSFEQLTCDNQDIEGYF